MTRKITPVLCLAFATSSCSTSRTPHHLSVVHLEAALAAQESASRVLIAVCQRHGGGKLQSQQLDRSAPSPAPDLTHWLDVDSPRQIALRHVSLNCGHVRLSEAWNWYIPSRISAKADEILHTTKRPFGLVVGPRSFYRQRLPALKNNLPAGVILQQRAVLRRRLDDQPIAFVIENYMRSAAFP